MSLTIFAFLGQSGDLILIYFCMSVLFVFIFNYNGLYRINIIITRAAHLAGILKAFYYGSLNVVLVSLLLEGSQIIDSRFMVFAFILMVLPFIYVVRIEALRYVFIRYSNSSFKRNVIILGNGKAGKLLATKLMYENPIGLNIIGFVDDRRELNDEVVIGKKIIGHLKDLKQLIEANDVNELIVADDDPNSEYVLDVIDTCKRLHVNVRVSSELFDIVGKKIVTEKYAGIPVIDVSTHYNNTASLGMKRVTDLVISTIAIILLSPLMLLIVLLIKLSSPGPVLFHQMRVGRYGRQFKFYKFRSMKVLNGEDEERKKMMLDYMNDPNVKSKIINDNRVTWIGKIIRRTSLDELPQLFNVLKGDMSLVGPRPCLPYEYENYDEWQKRRVSVIPGCTGVWQVWGRSSVSFKESVVLDLYYINNMSPWFDLQLLFQTVPAILTARGAK
jgi:exopolysaccharide biosynthesis polyprenyl glycosylphosphotransferase